MRSAPSALAFEASTGWMCPRSALAGRGRHRRLLPENVRVRKNFIETGWTTRPGGPGEPKNVAGGATPGRLRPPEGPDALGRRAVDSISRGGKRVNKIQRSETLNK